MRAARPTSECARWERSLSRGGKADPDAERGNQGCGEDTEAGWEKGCDHFGLLSRLNFIALKLLFRG
jgi:hypothetical protein